MGRVCCTVPRGLSDDGYAWLPQRILGWPTPPSGPALCVMALLLHSIYIYLWRFIQVHNSTPSQNTQTAMSPLKISIGQDSHEFSGRLERLGASSWVYEKAQAVAKDKIFISPALSTGSSPGMLTGALHFVRFRGPAAARKNVTMLKSVWIPGTIFHRSTPRQRTETL
jgi:hypothetical protein